MFFQRIKTPGLAHNAYLIGSDGVAAVIDPRRDVEVYVELARKNDLTIKYVLETHRQEDFVLGSAELKKITGAKIVSGKHEYFAHSDLTLADGEDFKMESIVFRCLYTPGHTPESVSYVAFLDENPDKAWGVFTGDALFIGEAGRTDLPDPKKTAENAGILFDSIHTKILPLGGQTLLYPAHGSGSVCGGNIAEYDESTLGFEQTYNVAFCSTRAQFIDAKLKERIPRPPYFSLMEVLNLKGGLPLSQSLESIAALSAAEFEQRSKKEIILDARSPEAFAGAHIEGSYNIWLEGLPTFGGWIASDQTSVYLILDREADLETAFLSLQRIGVDKIAGYLVGGFDAWRDAGFPFKQFKTIGVNDPELKEHQVGILDVRQITEFEDGHISGAENRFVGYLNDESGSKLFEKDKPLVITCSVGHRASLAASMLERKGFQDVRNLLGGMTAWKKLKKPMEKSAK